MNYDKLFRYMVWCLGALCVVIVPRVEWIKSKGSSGREPHRVHDDYIVHAPACAHTPHRKKTPLQCSSNKFINSFLYTRFRVLLEVLIRFNSKLQQLGRFIFFLSFISLEFFSVVVQCARLNRDTSCAVCAACSLLYAFQRTHFSCRFFLIIFTWAVNPLLTIRFRTILRDRSRSMSRKISREEEEEKKTAKM